MKWSMPEKIIEAGRDYVKTDRVQNIQLYPEEKCWQAEVLGKTIHHVTLDGTAKEQDQCDCVYWQNHGFCKHTIAVELAIKAMGVQRYITPETLARYPKQQAKTAPSQKLNEDFAALFLETENDSEPIIANEQYHLAYMIESKTVAKGFQQQDEAQFLMSLKFGQERLYVVKDLAAFLACYAGQKTYQIQEETSFSMQRDYFKQADQVILDQLSALLASQKMFRQMQYQEGLIYQKKYFIIMPAGAEKFVQLLSEQTNFTFKLAHTTMKEITFVHEKQPLAFYLSEHTGTFDLQLVKKIQQAWRFYHWLLIDDQLIVLDELQQRIWHILQQILQRSKDEDILIQSADTNDFLTYTLPMLKQIGSVTLSEALQKSILQADLQVRFHIKIVDRDLQVRVDFVYDEYCFSTAAAHQKLPDEELYVIRDQKKEAEIAKVLNKLAFQETTTGFRKMLPTDETKFYFFHETIPQLKKWGKVFLTKSLQKQYIPDAEIHTSVEQHADDPWLSIHFNIEGIEQAEIAKILEELSNKKNFYQLADGTLLSLLTPEMRKMADTLQTLGKEGQFERGWLQLPSYKSLEVDKLLGKQTNIEESAYFKQMVQDLKNPADYLAMLPQHLQATLRPYQKVGFQWLKMLSHYGFGGILADDMGLGKTLQSITYFLSELENTNENKTFLIIAPASLVYNWQHECQKFAPQLETVVIQGSKSERSALIEHCETQQVVITSYASFRQDENLYQAKHFAALLLDEAQMVKNYRSKTAQSIRHLQVAQKFALSGTPVENRLEELWSIFQILMPGFFPGLKAFKQLSNKEISQMIQPFVLRRMKQDVLPDLPDKIETNLYSSLTKEQKTVYLAYLQQMQANVKGMNNQMLKKNRLEILAGLTRLRQICCDPHLFLPDFDGDSGKLQQLEDLLVTAKENGRRILLFSQFTSMLDIIQERLRMLKLESFYLNGSTPVKERIEMVDAFNEGERDVFLISLKAGGTGLNLVGADTVILYDLWWNPAVEEQAAGRAHRIGQKHVVEVWRLIAEGTIEERMYQLQQEKRNLFAQVIHPDHEQVLQQLTDEDIRDILNI